MGRPRKKGLDYFSFDTDFFSDPKIKVLKARYGTDGIAVYIYLLCEIYRDNGYYMEISEDTEFIIADDLRLSPEKVKQILEYLFSRSLLIKKKISTLAIPVTTVTAAGIQKRYQMAVKDRAAKNVVEVRADVWVLKESETETSIKVCPNEDYSEKNEGFSEKNSSKSEKKCINKIKENIYIDIYKPPAESAPIEEEKTTRYFDDDALDEVFKEYLQMRKERGEKLTKTQIQSLGTSLTRLSEDMTERIKIVRAALEHGWKGFYRIKEEKPKSSGTKKQPKKKGSFYNFEQRSYDSSLERQLLGLGNKEGDST